MPSAGPSPAPSDDTLAVNAATVDSDTGLRFPTPPPPLPEATLPPTSHTIGATGRPTVATRRQSPDGKERDEARDATGVEDELGKSHRGRSIHEIPLRPTRDGQAAAAAVMVGGPTCDDSGVDMGTSSWP